MPRLFGASHLVVFALLLLHCAAPGGCKDVDDNYVDTEGPVRQDETSRDKTRRAGQAGVQSVQTEQHVGQALGMVAELWKSGGGGVADGAGGTTAGPATQSNNAGDDSYQALDGDLPSLPFDSHTAGQSSVAWYSFLFCFPFFFSFFSFFTFQPPPLPLFLIFLICFVLFPLKLLCFLFLLFSHLHSMPTASLPPLDL
jgi:hypothetical protein